MADYVITLQTPDTQVVTVTEPQTTVLPSNLVPVTPLYNNAVSAQTASLAVLSLSANTASLALSANAALFATSASRAAMAGTFTSGSAANLTAGTLPDARLSSNVPLKNATLNAFAGSASFAGDVTITGELDVGNGLIQEQYTSGMATYRNVALYNSDAQNVTGSIVVKTGIPTVGANRMCRVRIVGYHYDSTGPFEVSVGFYRYGTGDQYINTGYTSTGTRAWQVRLCNSPDGFVCIILDDVASRHDYLKLWVADFMVGYQGFSDAYARGWSITTVTDLTGYTNLSTVPDRTAVNATNIISGSLADARLSSNVPLKNTANTFTGIQTVSGSLLVNTSVQATPGYFQADRANNLSTFLSKITGDTNARWYVNSNGTLAWSDGTSAGDTNLYRSGSAMLKTDGSLVVGLEGDGSGTLRVGGTATAGQVLVGVYNNSNTALSAAGLGMAIRMGNGTPMQLGTITTAVTNGSVGNESGKLSIATRITGTLAERLQISNTGHILPGADGTQDLGASTTGFRHMYLTGNVSAGGTTHTLGAGLNASTTVTIGSGDTAPTTNRAVSLILDSPHSVAATGASQLVLRRGGEVVWQIGFTPSSAGAKTSADDFHFYNGSAFVAALSQAGKLRLSGGLDFSTDNTVDIGGSTGNRPRNLYVAGSSVAGGTTTGTNGVIAGSSLAASATYLISNTAAGINRGLLMQSAGVNRWMVGVGTSAEAGADSGAPLGINAYSDTGTFIDTPMSVFRAAGGPVVFARPLQTTTSELFDLTLNGSAANQRQIRLGGTYGSTLGTRYSGADLWLAWNAHQNTTGSDSWAQSTSTTLASVATRHHLGGWTVYYAPIGKASGSMASFWGSSLFTVGTSGNLLVSGNIDFNGTNTADIGATSAPRDVFVGRNLSVNGTSTLTGAVTLASGMDSYGAVNTRNGGNAIRLYDSGSITHGYVSFHTTGSVRKGWLGYGSNGTNVLSLNNELAGGPIYLTPSGSYIRLAGQLDWATDGTEDIGRSSSNRPRHGYFGGLVMADTGFGVGATPGGSYAVNLAGANSTTFGANITSTADGTASLALIRLSAGTVNTASGYVGAYPHSHTNTTLSGRLAVIANSDAKGLVLWTGGTGTSILVAPSGNPRWAFSGSGAFLAVTDNSVDIGTSVTNRPRNVYAASNVSAGASVTAGTDLTVGGSAYISGSNFVYGYDDATSRMLTINSAAGTNTGIALLTAGVGRWHIRTQGTANSGGDAGSALEIVARNDSGSLIDSVLVVTRAAGGSFAVSRPILANAGLTLGGSASMRDVTFQGDSTYDVGTAAANRPRDVFIGRNLSVGGVISGTASNATTLNSQSGSYYLDAGNLTGVVADARLSTNVPLLDALNTFTSQQAINGTLRNAFKPMATNEWSGPTAAGAYGVTQGATVTSGSTALIQHYFAYRATHAVYARSGSGEYGFYTQGPYAHPVIEVMAGGHALTGWASDSPMRDSYLYQQVKGPAQSATTASVRITSANSSWLFGVQNTLNFVLGGGLVHNGAVVLNSGSLQNVSINAALLDSGTLADTRLSSNVPLKNTSNSFTGALTASAFSGNGAGISGVVSASYATTSSYALAVLGGTASASYAANAGFSTLAATASYVTGPNVNGAVASANTLNNQSASFYTNASNLAAGVVPNNRISGSYSGISVLSVGEMSASAARLNTLPDIFPVSLSVNNPERGLWNPHFSGLRSSEMVWRDEDFAQGLNGLVAYNNQAANDPGAVTLNRRLGDGPPNNSGYVVDIMYRSGSTTPNLGGFIQSFSAKRNTVIAQRFIAKVPVGYSVTNAENNMGSNNNIGVWLTSKAGTGKWEEYVRVTYCGNTGSFSSGGHISLVGPSTPGTAFTWSLASCTAFEVENSMRWIPSASFADTLNGQSGSYYLDAGNLTGTVSDARLSSNVPLKNASATTFTGPVTASAFAGSGAGLTGVVSASYATNAGTATLAISATTATSASFATNSINTTTAVTASYVAAANVKGTVVSASFAQNALTANSATTATTATTASFFNMSNATMGTLDSARLPTNVARNDLANTFTATQTVTGSVLVSNGIVAASVEVPNASAYYSRTTTNAAVNVIGVSSGNKVSIDPGAYGAVFGGTVSFAGALQTLAQSAGTNLILQTSVTGDSNQRLQLDTDGKLLWGSGAAVGDTNLYRSAAGTLKTDGSLVATGTVTVSGSMTVGGRNVGGQVVSTSAPSGSAPEGTVWYQV